MLRGHDLLGSAEVVMKDSHREGLLPAALQAVEAAGMTMASIAAVVCGEGPGSFTSLRVAAGLAKGLSSARGLPLFAVSSLALTVAAEARLPGRYLVVADALRGEQFAAAFQVGVESLESLGSHRLMANDDAARWADDLGATVVGPNLGGSMPRAAAFSRLSLTALLVKQVSLASWEPLYGRPSAAQTGSGVGGLPSC